MRKVFLAVVLASLVLAAANHGDAILLPERVSTPNPFALPAKALLSPKPTVDSWIGPYSGGGDPNYILGGVGYVDTFLVWFNPPAKCSLLAGVVCYAQKSGEWSYKVPIHIFIASVPQDYDYENDFPEYHGGGPPSTHTSVVQTVYAETVDSITAEGYWEYDTVWIPTANIPDNGTDIFAVGWVKTIGDTVPHPYIFAEGNPPYHTLMHRDVGYGFGWYSSYHFIWAEAYVRYYENPPPTQDIDALPNSYTTEPRDVYVHATDFGVPLDSTGVASVVLEYTVNSSAVGSVSGAIVDGDSADGYWVCTIPGVNAGDTVTYYTIATDYQGKADTSDPATYIIKAGTPDHALYVKHAYYMNYSDVIDTLYAVDDWDLRADGPPDSSVIAFYTPTVGSGYPAIIWQGWGDAGALSYRTFGSGVEFPGDSVYLKAFLDAGGGFWYADQDMGYALLPDSFYDFGTHNFPTTHWAYVYLGLHTFTDDGAVEGDSFSVFGDPSDAVVGPLFDGVGNQNPGFLTFAPFAKFGGGYNYPGGFDALDDNATVDMMHISGVNMSYRLENVHGGSGKVVVQSFASDWVLDPTQPFDPDSGKMTYDDIAADSVNIVYMNYFSVPFGVGNDVSADIQVVRVEKPTRTVFSDMTTLRYYLPKEAYVTVNVVDISGRTVKVIEKGTRKAGWNSVIWDAKGTPAGTYFLSVSVNGDVKGNRKVVVVR